MKKINTTLELQSLKDDLNEKIQVGNLNGIKQIQNMAFEIESRIKLNSADILLIGEIIQNADDYISNVNDREDEMEG